MSYQPTQIRQEIQRSLTQLAQEQPRLFQQQLDELLRLVAQHDGAILVRYWRQQQRTGFDLSTRTHRAPLPEEYLLNLLPSGYSSSNLEERGLLLVLPREVVLCYHLNGQELTLLLPHEAEQLDGLHPGQYLFLPSQGQYSVPACPRLFRRLLRLSQL